MKILDENGKFFGKISIIDLAVLIVIILAILGGLLVYGGMSRNSTSAKGALFAHEDVVSAIDAKISIKNIRSATKDAIKVGDELYIGETDSTPFGKVTAIEESPYTLLMSGNDGEIEYVEEPEKYNVMLTVRFDGVKNEKGFFTKNKVHIALGEDLTIETMYIKTTTTVESLEVVPGTEKLAEVSGDEVAPSVEEDEAGE